MQGMSFCGRWKCEGSEKLPKGGGSASSTKRVTMSQMMGIMGRKTWECKAVAMATEHYVLQHYTRNSDATHVFHKKVRIFLNPVIAKLFPKSVVKYEHDGITDLIADDRLRRVGDDEKGFGDCGVWVDYDESLQTFNIIWELDKEQVVGRLYVEHRLADGGARMRVTITWEPTIRDCPGWTTVKSYKRLPDTREDRDLRDKYLKSGYTPFAIVPPGPT